MAGATRLPVGDRSWEARQAVVAAELAKDGVHGRAVPLGDDWPWNMLTKIVVASGSRESVNGPEDDWPW